MNIVDHQSTRRRSSSKRSKQWRQVSLETLIFIYLEAHSFRRATKTKWNILLCFKFAKRIKLDEILSASFTLSNYAERNNTIHTLRPCWYWQFNIIYTCWWCLNYHNNGKVKVLSFESFTDKSNQQYLLGSGCDSVGRVVVSFIRGSRFKSSRWQKKILSTAFKRRKSSKRPKNGPN